MNQTPSEMESTATLLMLVREGDSGARERLCSTYLPMLQKWAHGRLPSTSRSLVETDDLVQVSLLRALDRIDSFEPRREGAFLAYLRRILLNSIRDEIRKSSRSPNIDTFEEQTPRDLLAPVEKKVGLEVLESYEKGLASLPEKQKESVILRVEFGFTFPEITSLMEFPPSNPGCQASKMPSTASRHCITSITPPIFNITTTLLFFAWNALDTELIRASSVAVS